MSVECPYCNALVPLPSDARDGLRVPCPRCGEVFPLRGLAGIQAPPGIGTAPSQGGVAISVPDNPKPITRPPNRMVAFGVLALMGMMACAALFYALASQGQRRANDIAAIRPNRHPIFPEPDDDKAALTVTPTKLDALGYLPPGSNLILGVHVRRLRQSPAGRDFLIRKWGKSDFVLADMLNWTGLEIDELDHVVLGVRTEDVSLPRVVLAVRTSRSIDRRRVIEKLKAEERPGGGRGEPVYRFALPGIAAHEAKLWFAADGRTLVVDLYGNLDDVPETPRWGLDHLPLSVRDALKTRVDAGSVVWLAAAVDDWEKMTDANWFKALRTFTRGLNDDLLRRLVTLRVLAVGTQMAPELKTQMAFRCKDARATVPLRQSLVPADDKLPAGVTVALAEDWLTVQWKEAIDAVVKELGK